MEIQNKDISLLAKREILNGTEKIVVSENEFLETSQFTGYTDNVVRNNGNSTLNAAMAYTDSMVKSYEVLSLYLSENGVMKIDKPIGTGSLLNTTINTTEKLLWTQNYPIPTSGVTLADNLYQILLPFTNLSQEKIVTIRLNYSVNGNLMFDIPFTFATETTNFYNLNTLILNERIEDFEYTAGMVATLKVYGRVSSGSSNISLTVENQDKLAMVLRSLPISVLSDDKIKTNVRGFVESLHDFNTYVLTKLQQ